TQEMQTVGFIDEGWLISLNEYIANSPELISQIHEPLFNSFTWKGVIGSLPVVTFVSMFYYNPVLFQEAGLPLPESISWDDLVNLGNVLTKKSSDGHVIQYGHRVEYEPNFCLYYLWQNGGGILDESCRNSILNTDATRGAVDFIYDLAWLHEIIPKPWEMGEYLLELGNLAMYTHGSWMTGYYDELFGFNDFDALPVPIGKYEVSMAYPNGFGISAASPHPDEAWEFLKFASGPEGQRILAAAGLGIPINSDPSVAAVYLEGRTMKQRRAALEAVTTAQAPRVVPGMQDDIIARYVWPLLDQVWTNQRPVTQVLQELDRLVQQYLDQVYAR
ncbi:MAG: extracellular solute-binding protein, partial [Limnochordia bacterium]